MSYHATDNLRCYLREAVLPAMLLDPAAPQLPPPGHKSHHNILSVRPESWRRLENMFSVREASIDQMITAWIDTHIPEESLGDEDTDCITGEMFTIPCPPLFDVPIHHERRPTDIRRLSPWIDNLPLMTVQRALHLVFPQTSGWGFHLDGAEDKDRSIFQYFTWRPQDSEKTTPELLSTNGISSRRPVVIAFQPPWILSERDMKEFSESRSFPPFCMPGNAFPSLLESSDRLWAKLWDLCVGKNSSWFVLTSYNHWVFGAFSAGWTTGFVTGLYSFATYSPTIIECLMFWIASAMRLPGCCQLPKVPEPMNNLGSVPTPATSNTRYPTPAVSESNWDGKSEDAASSAEVYRTLSPAISDAGLPCLALPINRPDIQRYHIIQQWVQNGFGSHEVLLNRPGRDGLSSRLMSGHMNQHCGDWLV